MFSENTLQIQKMFAGLQVEFGHTLRIMFKESSYLVEFLKLGFEYKLLYQDPELKVILTETQYLPFANGEFRREGMCLLFPYELSVIPNLLWVSKPGFTTYTCFVPHVYEPVIIPPGILAEYGPGSKYDQLEAEQKSLITLPVQPVIQRGHLRLISNTTT